MKHLPYRMFEQDIFYNNSCKLCCNIFFHIFQKGCSDTDGGIKKTKGEQVHVDGAVGYDIGRFSVGKRRDIF